MESGRFEGAGIVSEKPISLPGKKKITLYERIRQILESVRTVNTTQVLANWLIGREIIEEEQRGRYRADYGKQLVEELSVRLQEDFGNGYSANNLWFFRRFYLEYPRLASSKIFYALPKESAISGSSSPTSDRFVPGEESTDKGISNALRSKSEAAENSHALH
jgi:hypothetical protein